ncbi:hypothetical protein ACG33_06950 [Steroidobacter denitrificans]|uniref:Ribosome maturation factor RimP n=1 Tax=Steroidobacter denitrificans TaxID=465721 RepID=A0A127FBB2_STEDE|nr:ribosome maturation factor RimP [Steroidobacter denitrificans]AMN46839.1 hypothetical protein ACG33_06950 [Steroidobacter denitrificans]
MLRDQLSELLGPIVAGLGYELWELEYVSRGGGLLRLYIDTPAGVTVEDCERVSRAVSETLDAADPIPGEYTLEVSSPGLDRVLRRPAHFERFTGERVKLEMMQPLDGRKRFVGRLLRVAEQCVTLELDDGACGAETVTLPIDDIHKARLVPPL